MLLSRIASLSHIVSDLAQKTLQDAALPHSDGMLKKHEETDELCSSRKAQSRQIRQDRKGCTILCMRMSIPADLTCKHP